MGGFRDMFISSNDSVLACVCVVQLLSIKQKQHRRSSELHQASVFQIPQESLAGKTQTLGACKWLRRACIVSDFPKCPLQKQTNKKQVKSKSCTKLCCQHHLENFRAENNWEDGHQMPECDLPSSTPLSHPTSVSKGSLRRTGGQGRGAGAGPKIKS